ncbi:MAG: phospho-sugar mutase [Deltaproteobacteria bacterium]|nr:MAG: phospho-sugar mutase [Deltaproteobacteria bacterium]
MHDAIRRGIESLDVAPEHKTAALASLESWLTRFPDHAPAIDAMSEAGRFDELLDAFRRVLPFGTGGRRGRVGLGPNRFNAHTLATSAAGHAAWMRAHHDGPLSVVITWDVRRFDDLGGAVPAHVPHPLAGWTSKDFGHLAARVYAQAGIDVHLLPPDADRVMSTPELSHAIRVLNATGGLMISASHNPPDDNGAKVYDHLGGQLVPPLDQEVLTAVAAVSEVQPPSWEEALASGHVHFIDDEVRRAYQDLVLSCSIREERGLRVAFSPLHGAGLYSVLPVLERAGFDVVPVEPQCTADGAFPTVPFRAPNPEVPSALELGIAYAEDAGATLLLATDPDADRIGAVVRHEGGWQRLSGNEIGALIVDHLARHGHRGLVARTEVTTSLISRIAEGAGMPLVDDLLVGFKYIGEILATWEGPFAAGVEESHGVLVTAEMRDKDAAGGALLLAEAAAVAATEGKTLVHRLDALTEAYGRHDNRLASLVMEGATGQLRIARMLDAFRESPPESLGGRAVTRFRDRRSDTDPLGPVKCETDASSRNVLVFELEGARMILRPSGTEPKAKIYTEVIGGSPEDAAQLERALVGEGLSRVGVDLPTWALAISSLVSIEARLRFVDAGLPELLASPTPDTLTAVLGDRASLYADAVAEWAEAMPERQAVARLFG